MGFRPASHRCEKVLEAVKLAHVNETKVFPRNLPCATFGKLLIVFLTVDLLYLLHLIALRYCLLHLINKSCFF